MENIEEGVTFWTAVHLIEEGVFTRLVSGKYALEKIRQVELWQNPRAVQVVDRNTREPVGLDSSLENTRWLPNG